MASMTHRQLGYPHHHGAGQHTLRPLQRPSPHKATGAGRRSRASSAPARPKPLRRSCSCCRAASSLEDGEEEGERKALLCSGPSSSKSLPEPSSGSSQKTSLSEEAARGGGAQHPSGSAGRPGGGAPPSQACQRRVGGGELGAGPSTPELCASALCYDPASPCRDARDYAAVATLAARLLVRNGTATRDTVAVAATAAPPRPPAAGTKPERRRVADPAAAHRIWPAAACRRRTPPDTSGERWRGGGERGRGGGGRDAHGATSGQPPPPPPRDHGDGGRGGPERRGGSWVAPSPPESPVGRALEGRPTCIVLHV
ncbi:dapper homolog 3-like [Sorghum bicolor]|uniref:dapper homolog 3-like n=1 Tax=Sorghum bicolor TaxID=4558 RepID=UPI000B423AF8|nr:dapper homolog 3-like [Sorghum bicolor]|eukprot:XP_021304942.1 dapper homolog 3-like [Sorghum bicolor]